MPENFPNLIENINQDIQESQQTPSKTNSKRYTQDTRTRHTRAKLSKSQRQRAESYLPCWIN